MIYKISSYYCKANITFEPLSQRQARLLAHRKGEGQVELHHGLRSGLEAGLGQLDLLHDLGLVEVLMFAGHKEVKVENNAETKQVKASNIKHHIMVVPTMDDS